MPNDFAKKKAPRKSRGASRQNKKQSAPIGLWIVTILMVAGLAGGLSYLKWFKTDKQELVLAKPKQITPKQKKPAVNITQTAVTSSDDDIPLYNLHEDLINKEVVISAEDLKLPDNVNKYYYTMPCGSFRESFRADELKAQIAMTGNTSKIDAVQYKGETWYRVQLGPFNRKRAAESVRHRLQDNNVHGCIINPHLIKKK
jgi:cell division protein FtsN